ncbi:MAG: hypothetical protein KDB29_11070, partial [Planctomycetes bacterium]|nr:hypothetical protein [Planctomycetota bacterium]
ARRKKSKKAEEKEAAAAALKALQEEEDKALAADSDRLDYLTDEEAEQLSKGEAPSKRLRNVIRKPA